jgi:hypothetical protein
MPSPTRAGRATGWQRYGCCLLETAEATLTATTP